MTRAAAVAALLLLATAAAADDLCDISLQPAATLLLPYFEVDVMAPPGQGETTLFTVMNTTDVEQIAHVTLWTDWGFPALDFNIYLTGYDVQSINLYDVLNGRIAPPNGTGVLTSPVGDLSDINPALDVTRCANMPGNLDPALVLRIKQAFVLGRVPAYEGQPGCMNIGGVHTNAVGYATIDVVRSCTTFNATHPEYHTDVLRFDNVLAGDSQQLDGAQNYAQSAPLVHIRSMPDESLARTFYQRYQPEDAKKRDRRQPLPSTFAARWISGGAGDFQTTFKIWREGMTGAGAACNTLFRNGGMTITEVVNFDDEENAVGSDFPPPPFEPIGNFFVLPSASRVGANTGEIFPQQDSNAGWMYLNFNDATENVTRQAWVISSMRAEGRYSVDGEAAALGDGCVPRIAASEISTGTGTVGPVVEEEISCDIALLPAATLLLPYFEVDITAPQGSGETTLFTITNTSDREQAVRVTLWTDYGYPVLYFNIYLTGYDVQSINLFDVIALGQLAPTRGTGYGDAGSPEGAFSSLNPALRREPCSNLPMQLAPEYRGRMQQAFIHGAVPAFGSVLPACNDAGGVHTNAVGYATIDVVNVCGILSPEHSSYYTNELAFDNVLVGDYQQVDSANDAAQGGPLVHIRAVSAERSATLGNTFYARFQADRGNLLDRRQPLPSVFAARWISGSDGGFETDYKVWRDGVSGTSPSCTAYAVNGSLEIEELVRFDEEENVVAHDDSARLPSTSRFVIADGADIAGWTILDLDRQAWVTTSMRAAGRFSIDHDAIAVADGCDSIEP